MKKILRMCFVMVFLSMHWMAFGQGKTITGKVTDDAGLPLPGVSVVIEGTTDGTITDFKGQYSLLVPADKQVLVYSFIGFKTVKLEIADRTVINLKMDPEVLGIDEVVVVGYGTMKKSDLSGASVSVSGESLKASGSPSIDQALQGRAAGVVAVNTSGQPGASVSIRIRGQGTLNAAAEPLYVIDGIPMQNVSQGGHDVGLGDALGNGSVSTFSGLSSINPADIESLEVLKDASATAIYGSRGANGVVLITTKKGKKGDAKFTYDGEYGVQEQVKRIDVMNLREYAEYNNVFLAENRIVRSDGNEYYNDPSLLGAGTDWQEAVFQISPKQSHQFSASGGSEKTDYYVSASYFNQEGTVVGSDFDRFTGKVNLNTQVKKWMKLGTNMSLATTEDNIGLNNSSDGIISVALKTTPDIPVYNTDGTYSGDEREGSPGNINPIAKALEEENTLKRLFVVSNIYTDITFTKGLTLRTEAGLNITNTNAYHFEPTFVYGNVSSDNNEASKQYSQSNYWEFKNYLTYTSAIGKHNITGMLGQEVSEWSWEFIKGTGTGLPSNDIHEPGLAPLTNQLVGSGHGSGARASMFARFNYSFNDRYFLTYTFRRDGSSNFGPSNRWANFHSVAGSWRVSNEPWFKTAVGDVVNNFKIRAGWGQTGNDAIGGYLWGSAIGKMDTGLGQGFKQSNIANPYIQWETQEQTNLGFDFGFFNSRIDLVVDIYNKESKAMLMSMELPSYMGTSGNASSRLNPPMGNFGHIQNKGFEVTLNTQPIAKQNFKWDSDLSVTRNRNELIALNGTPAAAINGYGQWTDLVTRTELGQPLYNFYGYVTDGVYQDYEDVINSPQPETYPSDGNFARNRTVWVGDQKFKDISGPNGKPDGKIDENDRTVIGSPLPDFTFGWTNTFRYEGFELGFHIIGSYGNDLMNYVGRSISGAETVWSNQLTSVTDRAQLELIDPTGSWDNIQNVRVKNPSATAPRGVPGDPNANMRISDRYIEDGSYIRFKNITFAYYVPKRILEPMSISNLKLYVSLQNMWTFTKYTGFDPEVGASQTSTNVYGLDNGRYPSPRVYSCGLSVTF
jgi:TonB-dependent starch-binding outer membrane protein SusC